MKKIILSALLGFLLATALPQNEHKTESMPGLKVEKKALQFIAFGDWGRNGEYKQKEVALELGIVAKQVKAAFIISTGDNFYPSGVRSTQDHNWVASFENIYTAHSLQTDWYVVLGNHDYKGSPQAEVDYTKLERRWNMPARYYSKKIFIKDDSTQQILLVFIDTSPFISQYYESPDHQENVKSQDTAAQRKWLEEVLADKSPHIRWKIVVGHHPLYTGGGRINSAETKELNRRLKPIFDKYKVDAYICGHEHSLQYIKPAGPTHYFISGSGSEITPANLYPQGGRFAQSENGFMVFTLSPSSMQVQVLSYEGKILYTSDPILH
jgi:tartrate-resistant acid phosphatase type 5